MAEPLLDLRGVRRHYGTDPPVEALRGIDLVVEEGDWLAIAGPSGSGKSTLLNIVGCLDVPTSGTYRFAGVEVGALSDRERSALRSRSFGFVFQAFHLLAHRPVVENVMLAEVYRGREPAGRRERALASLEQVGLGDRATFLPTRLSGGERQRAAIARALMTSPRLLLCDEPTGNLDSATTESILELFAELSRAGLTIVMITHEHDVAARAAHQIHIVDGMLKAA